MTNDTTNARRWPDSKWSASRLLHIGIALAFIALYIVAGNAQSRVSRPPADVELSDLEYPVSFGPHRALSEADLVARIAGEPLGYPIELRDATGRVETRFVTQPGHSAFYKLITRLNGLFFLTVSLIVFAPRIDKLPARDLFWACTLYGLAVMIGDIYTPQGNVWPGVLLPVMRIVSLVILPILLLHVGLTFPRRATVLDRHPHLMHSIVTLGGGIAVWQSWVWTRWFAESSPTAWTAIAPAREAGAIFLAVVFGSGCLGLVRGTQLVQHEREREQAKWLLWGITMGAVPFIFFHALPIALGRAALLPIEIARLFSVIIPIAFSFAVIRYRFLDVDIIIRRSLLYVLLASMLVGVYMLLGIFVGRRVEESWPATGPIVPIVATLVAVLLFDPTRRAIATMIDRVFFKIRYDHAHALDSFREELAAATDQQDIAQRLAAFLDHNLVPASIAVELYHGERRFEAGEAIVAWASIPGARLTIAVGETTARPGIESSAFPQAWSRAGYVLAQQIRGESHDVGLVLLAPKQTGRSYVSEDLDLLAAAAAEAGRRVRRMNLEQDYVNQVVARHQMEEMNRFRTDFFAQFAHDLRSPLTSINWGARNLLDGVVGEVSDAQRGYLEGIESSARQLVRLVNNLLEVTRLESGMPEVELTPVNLAVVIDDSIAKLRANAIAKRVEIMTTYADVPLVQGHTEKLLEVLDNLIENAIRYSPPDSTIEVDLAAMGNEVDLRVQDRGPGLDAGEIEAIFEPYRQGRPSPHSTQHGFGLGLFVVRSWIERMGGRVEASNRPDKGACFRISIPAASQPLEELREESA
jgi:signal transduction histidine kinase